MSWPRTCGPSASGSWISGLPGMHCHPAGITFLFKKCDEPYQSLDGQQMCKKKHSFTRDLPSYLLPWESEHPLKSQLFILGKDSNWGEGCWMCSRMRSEEHSRHCHILTLWGHVLPKFSHLMSGQVLVPDLVSEWPHQDPENTLAQAFGLVPGCLSCVSWVVENSP